MQIVHRISINGDIEAYFFREIKRLGIEYMISPLPGASVGIVTFEIEESNLLWEIISAYASEYTSIDMVRTTFSEDEILHSEWNRIVPTYTWGFPQPEHNVKWKIFSYNNCCQVCGAGYQQKAPFQIKQEPNLKQNHFFTLNWVYTIFCENSIVEDLKNNTINGYEAIRPIIQTAKQPSATVSQLYIPTISNPGLSDEDKVKPSTCPSCGIIKYSHHKRGVMKYQKLALQKGVDIQLLYEWFGSGGKFAFREIIISNQLSEILLKNKWKGIVLKPIEAN